MKQNLVLLGLCVFFMGACTESQVSELVEEPLHAETKNSPELQKINEGNWLSILRWSKDSANLTYLLDDNYWQYRIFDNTTQIIGVPTCLGNTVFANPCKETDKERFFIPSGVGEQDISISPSGKIALFRVYVADKSAPNLETLEEDFPDDSGVPPLQDSFEIWISYAQTMPQRIGQIPTCLYQQPMWSSDESKVILARDVDIQLCGDYNAWVIDLEQKIITPVIPHIIYSGEGLAKAISPNGKYLLHGGLVQPYNNQLAELYILDLQSMKSTQIETPTFSRAIDWITEDYILVHYANDDTPQFLGPALFDLESKTVIPLANQLGYRDAYCIRDYAVSPDKNWLSFVGSIGCYKLEENWINELWLADLRSFIPEK